MKVVIAEKPSVARDIARVVGAAQKKDGWLEGNGYQVTWAYGHLITIAEPALMHESWGGKWNFKQLPMIPEQFKLTTVDNTQKQFNVIARLFDACDEIINATDAGREGELIFRWIYRHSKCDKPFKRLWISDLTDESIKEGLAKLIDGKEFDLLGHSAQCRSFADWMVGLNATRAYTIKCGELFTVGRVQTPTLALIVERYQLIQGFEKFYYYGLNAVAQNVTFRWKNKDGYKIEHKKEAEAIKKKCDGREGTIKDVKKSKRKVSAPSLYDLTLLQKECNEKFGYTAQKTLEYAQSLYETHKLITYPRTESRHLSEKMRKDLPYILKAAPETLRPFAKEAFLRLQNGLKLGKSYINDKKLTDHHAIIPTKKALQGSLNKDLNNVYALIQKRFIAIFLEEFAEDVRHITLVIEKENFEYRGSLVTDVGWRRIYMKNIKADVPLVEQYPQRDDVKVMMNAGFKKGQRVEIENVTLEEKEGAPPKLFTDGTLLNAMRYIGRQVDDGSIAAQLKDQGLGTQATRASIIERIIKSKYVYRKGKNLIPTEKGIRLINMVVEDLKSPNLTAEWEQKLSDIQEGRIDRSEFMKNIETFTRQFIPEISERYINLSKETFGACPQCKKGQMYEGRKSFYCSRYKLGCDFVLWSNIARKKLTHDEARALFKVGKTPLIKGFKSKADKPFSAIVELDREFKTRFRFDD